MKKRIAYIVILALLVSVFAGCSAQPAQQSAEPSGVNLGDESMVLFTVEGANVSSMTLGEYLALEQMTVTLSRTNSHGETFTGTYEGVHFTTLKDALGIGDFSSIELEASDGYTMVYTADILEDADSVFAVIQDGAAIESEGDGHMWFCGSENFTANNWCKYVVKITVVP